MSTLRKNVTISVEEYLEGEKWSDIRHEYVAGQPYAMVGVSEPHNLIVSNLLVALHQHLRGGPCRVFASELKVRVADNFYYPDLFVTCDPADDHLYFKIHPRLIIEVLSPSTEARHRLEKRVAYQSLESLEEYALVRQDKPEVQVNRRIAEGWDLESYAADDRIEFRSVGLSLPIETVFENVWRSQPV
jgi:Uma2 family endonuclease